MAQTILDTFQGSHNKLQFSLFEEPNEAGIILTGKKISITVCDIEWDQIVYEKNSEDDLDAIEKDEHCANIFYWIITSPLKDMVGEFLVDITIEDPSVEEPFNQNFRYKIVIRETIKSNV